MKRNNFLFFLPFAVVLLTLSACTVADEFDVFHRDGKTYLTSLKVHTGVPDGEELGTRTFFDTRDGYYGIVYWEDGKTPFWPEDGEGTFGPDHLYFFNYDLGNYQYVDSISDYFCAEQYSGDHHYDPNDPSKFQWATFKLQKGTPALQVTTKDTAPCYYGYYCPAVKNRRPGKTVTYDMELHDQNGQGNAVLRSYLRSSDVLWLEVPQPSDEAEGEIGPITFRDHSFEWKDTTTQDIYFNHIFSLVEVDIKRNDNVCTEWPHQGTGGGGHVHSVSLRSANKGSQNGTNTGEDSFHFNRLTDDQYLGNLSYLPMGNVDLVGNEGDSFLKTYAFTDYGEWYCATQHSTVRCTRTDPDKKNTSLLCSGHENNTVEYYFLVYSNKAISKLTVKILSPRYDADGSVSQLSPFERTIEFPLEDGFKFIPGKYYKLALDLGLPDKVSTAFDDKNEAIYDEDGKRCFLDRDWITSDYHLLAPSAEMKNMRWGIKFEADGTIKYKEQNEYPVTTN